MKTFKLCMNNKNYEASLELWKLYEIIDDEEAEKNEFVRVVDESGEDYLYPNSYFVEIDLPESVKKTIIETTTSSSSPGKV